MKHILCDAVGTPEPQAHERRRRVDAICDAFECAWRHGRRPTIEDFIWSSSLDDLAYLVVELSEIDAEYRLSAGLEVDTKNYCVRFPRFALVIAERLSNMQSQGDGALAETTVDEQLRQCSAPNHVTDCDSRGKFYVGRYELRELVGRGAFGDVWRASDPLLQRDVAIKMARLDQELCGRGVDLILSEGRKLARLSHPNIVPVYDAGEHRGDFYIVSEFITGKSLSEMIARGIGLSCRGIADLAAKVGAALDAAHRNNLVHRDVKPSNIIVDGLGIPHLVDFGFAASLQQLAGRTLGAAGTADYMAPEILHNPSIGVDGRADVFSLGVVLHELLTGSRPNVRDPHKNRMSKMESVPGLVDSQQGRRIWDQLLSVSEKCLALDPSRRFASAAELVDALLGSAKEEA